MSLEKTYFVSKTVSLGANGSSEFIVSLDNYKPLGYFSIQGIATTGGTYTVQYCISNDPEKLLFTAPIDVLIDVDTSNHMFAPFEPKISRYLKIIVTETSGNAGELSFHLAMQ